MQCLVEANPVAFVADVAIQAEEEYRAAAAVARNKLERLSLNPDSQRLCNDLADDIKNLRKERPYFKQPKPLHEVSNSENLHIILRSSVVSYGTDLLGECVSKLIGKHLGE